MLAEGCRHFTCWHKDTFHLVVNFTVVQRCGQGGSANVAIANV